MKYIFDDKRVDLYPLSPTIVKIKTFLDKQPLGKFFSTPRLGTLLQSSPQYFALLGRHEQLRQYQQVVRKTRFWGSKKSIAQLRKELNQEA